MGKKRQSTIGPKSKDVFTKKLETYGFVGLGLYAEESDKKHRKRGGKRTHDLSAKSKKGTSKDRGKRHVTEKKIGKTRLEKKESNKGTSSPSTPNRKIQKRKKELERPYWYFGPPHVPEARKRPQVSVKKETHAGEEGKRKGE